MTTNANAPAQSQLLSVVLSLTVPLPIPEGENVRFVYFVSQQMRRASNNSSNKVETLRVS